MKINIIIFFLVILLSNNIFNKIFSYTELIFAESSFIEKSEPGKKLAIPVTNRI